MLLYSHLQRGREIYVRMGYQQTKYSTWPLSIVQAMSSYTYQIHSELNESKSPYGYMTRILSKPMTNIAKQTICLDSCPTFPSLKPLYKKDLVSNPLWWEATINNLHFYIRSKWSENYFSLSICYLSDHVLKMYRFYFLQNLCQSSSVV